MTAQGIEAGTGETAGLDPQGESPVRQDAPDYILPPPLRDDGPLETMARAIVPGMLETSEGYSDVPLEHIWTRPRYQWLAEAARRHTRDAITALTEAGYAIVPVEPTEAMLAAGNAVEMIILPDCDPLVELPHTSGIYTAMIAAAPSIGTKEGE